MNSYYTQIKNAQTLLAEDPKSLFIGQSVLYAGTGMYDSISHIPLEKKYEFPIAENLQLGVCIGLSLQDIVPICIYPRWNFLLVAMDQIINHLDKLPLMTDGEFIPKVIIRVAIGSVDPVDPQNQHKGDFTDAFKLMCQTINVIRMDEANEIIPAYDYALRGTPYSSILVENSDFCKTK
jgi:pyruvate/2-oxoglutarate/acetoin dehydrogenase E1 component